MQPYFLPYLGYFQLVAAANVFVFYDDVHFMKKGWLRRNRIWSNKQELIISIPCTGASSNKLINEVAVATNHPDFKKIEKSILQSYARASEFQKIRPLVEQIFDGRPESLAGFNARTINTILNYLDLQGEMIFSSELAPETKGMPKSDRLIAITKKLDGSVYLNSSGGEELYDKEYFHSNGIELQFLHPQIPLSSNGDRKGMAMNLSIIDVIMWNNPHEVRRFLSEYRLA